MLDIMLMEQPLIVRSVPSVKVFRPALAGDVTFYYIDDAPGPDRFFISRMEQRALRVVG